MERADFVHLVRLSEQACAEDSRGYRRGVAAFAALGYGWVLGCVALAAGSLWWLSNAALRGTFRSWYVWGLLTALGLLWSSVRALWCRLDTPQGIRLAPADAPALFEALERIRRKVKGPPLHGVFLQDDLNACIAQRTRWGIFGGARNYLAVGLPLLMALDRRRVLAVLAHEYGHLRGDHGRFSAWIYRTRASWTRLYEGMDQDSVFGRATQGFLRWYFPRFVARTFALARQDEYEADRISGRLLGAEVAGAALVEIALKSDWLAERFWARHWRRAADSPVPVGPYQHMRAELALALPADFARDSLRAALKRIGDVDDTHPGLRDRLESLGTRAAVPEFSRGSGLELLGGKAPQWVQRLDREWCAANATEWKRHHAWLARVRTRAEQLRAMPAKSAEQWIELAGMEVRLDADAAVRGHYEQALAGAPGHARALRGLAASIPAGDHARRHALLEQLHEACPEYRWWAARTRVAELEADPGHDEALLKLWRARLKDADAAEARAWKELHEPPFLANAARHDLGDFEVEQLRLELPRYANLACAWVVRKHLREFPARRCYLLFIETRGLSEEDSWGLCHAIEAADPLPGALNVLCPHALAQRADIERLAGAPVYVASP